MAMTDTAAGATVYFPLFLRAFYDTLILGVYCSYIWQCPRERLQTFYNNHVISAEKRATDSFKHEEPVRLMDIGVGTGYFLEHAPLPTGSELTLVDLNGNCLNTAASRIIVSHPSALIRTVHADFLEPDTRSNLAISPQRLSEAKLELISCFLLLHCLPGPSQRKADAIIQLRHHLTSNGTIVGATVLGKGVPHNLFGKVIMFWHNLLGVFDNYPDGVKDLIEPLESMFQTVRWEVVGTMLLFEATV